MSLKFTITDYTTNPAGVSTVIDEPVGWDTIGMRLKRDQKWHGFFDFFDDSAAALEFVGTGYSILQTAYQAYGVQAVLHLVVEYACSQIDDYETVYTGRFVFSSYQQTCGDICSVKIGVESVSSLMQFRNRYNQKVDINSLTPFDPCQCNDTIEVGGVFVDFQKLICVTTVTGGMPADIKCINAGSTITLSGTAGNNGTFTVSNAILYEGNLNIYVNEPVTSEFYSLFTMSGCLVQKQLTPYAGLNKSIVLPSQPLRYISQWKQVETKVWAMDLLIPFDLYNMPSNAPTFMPDIPIIQDGVKKTLQGTAIALNTDAPNFSEVDKFIDFSGFNISCDGPARFKINIAANLVTHPGCPEKLPDSWQLVVIKGAEWNEVFQVVYDHPETAGPNRWSFRTTTGNLTINDTVEIPSFAAGDKLWVYFQFNTSAFLPNSGDHPNCFPDLQIMAGSAFQFESDSICEDTTNKIYLINEVMSRCTEAYTNDNMRVYSNYYGRTDAQPYAAPDEDGCGANRGIATGLILRNATAADSSSAPQMTVSMQDCFDALTAIDNIGMGVEPDTNRPGFEWIRVEPVQYFFQNAVVMECPYVAKLTQSVDAELLYSTFKSGYSKYETWNNNGLYDFFGTRNYRTDITDTQNELDRECKWIASNYAIEVTRRLYGPGTSDWRYDNDIFIVCLKNYYFGFGGTEYMEFVAPHTLKLYGSSDPNLFFSGDVISVYGTPQNGTYNITDVTIGVNQINLTLSQTVANVAATIGLVYNKTHVIKYVDTGISSSENILFPSVILNYPIAPSRNAIRWLKTVLQSYRNYQTGTVKFTNGTGNLMAKGVITSSCQLEADPIAENSNLSAAMLHNPEEHYPLYWPETVTFEYPVTWQQYLAIKANPYGLIGYQCGNGPMQYGWIEDFQLKPYTGMGQFTLRPKIES